MKSLFLAVALSFSPLAALAAVAPDNPTEYKFPSCMTLAQASQSAIVAAANRGGFAFVAHDTVVPMLLKMWNTAYGQKIKADDILVVVSAASPRAVLMFVSGDKTCSLWSMPATTLERWITALPNVGLDAAPTPSPTKDDSI